MSTFLFKSKVKTKGYPVRSIYRKSAKKGEIGIEIEVEGNKFPKNLGPSDNPAFNGELIPSQWKYTPDGSLRGADNAEYVLKNPILFSEVPKAIGDLWAMFSDYGSILDESNRTSVHVHLNVQEFHLNRLCAFMALYFSVEEILTEWCGEHRVGNLFCLRAKDAPAIVSRIKKMLQGGEPQFSDGMHYAGLNAQAMQKFGSLEIRSLRGVNEPQTILDWVSVLEHIYKLSAEFPDPRNICDGFSGEGPLNYFSMVLGPNAQLVRNNVSYTDQELMEVLYDGIRIAQDLCYCRDWSLYEPVELKPDPFDRQVEDLYGTLLMSSATPAPASGAPVYSLSVSSEDYTEEEEDYTEEEEDYNEWEAVYVDEEDE